MNSPFSQTTTDRAEVCIQKFKAAYKCDYSQKHRDKFNSVTYAVMNVAGPANRYLRQEIMEQLTGAKQPLAKCGITAIENAIEALILKELATPKEQPAEPKQTPGTIDLRKPAPQLDIFRPTQIPLF